jgi:hypothetical protein
LVSGGFPQREGRWHLLLRLNVDRFKRILGSFPQQFPDSVESSVEVQALLQLYEDLLNHGVKYSAVVQTYSNLRMDVTLSQDSHEPGALLQLNAVISEYGGPLRGSAHVSADITYPNGEVATLQLDHERDGYYSTALIAMTPGLYSVRFRANGTTYRNRPFSREQLRTASVWTGGDRPTETPHSDSDGSDSQRPRSGGLIDLLCCLYRHKGLSRLFFERLEMQGIDSDTLRLCLKAYCKARHKGESCSQETSLNLSSTQLATLQSQADRLISSFEALLS